MKDQRDTIATFKAGVQEIVFCEMCGLDAEIDPKCLKNHQVWLVVSAKKILGTEVGE